MARRRKMGAMSTTTTLLLVGGGVVLLYMFMSKTGTTATTAPGITYVPTNTAANNLAVANANNSAATTQTIVNDASGNVSDLINSIFG
jgi:hypothetical protein